MKLSLVVVYQDFWVKLLEFYGPSRERILNQFGAQPTSHEWVGFYKNFDDELPKWVVSVGYLKDSRLGMVQLLGNLRVLSLDPRVGHNTSLLLR